MKKRPFSEAPLESFGPQLRRAKPIPKYVDDIVSFWRSLGLTNHRKGTKTYEDIAETLISLRSGKAFNGVEELSKFHDRPMTKEDIMETIRNFSLAAINPDYEPVDGYKSHLRRMGLKDFIYNPFSKGKNKSLFVKYYKSPPKLARDGIRPINDEFPKITEQIKSIYAEKVLGGVRPRQGWSPVEENSFRRAAIRLQEILGDLRSRKKLVNWVGAGGSLERQVAEFLVDAVIHDVDDRPEKLTPAWLASDITFSRRLPAYLNWQGVLVN